MFKPTNTSCEEVIVSMQVLSFNVWWCRVILVKVFTRCTYVSWGHKPNSIASPDFVMRPYREVWDRLLPFQSCLLGVSRPRPLRQRSRTCWMRSSVHELGSVTCIIFCRGVTTSTEKHRRGKCQNENKNDALMSCSGKPI